jgi:acyl-coenzyme A thioesterase PaaI-like protein
LLNTFNDEAPIARALGMRLSFDQDKSAIVSLAPNGQLASAARPPRQAGMLHGGMYGVVADTAGERQADKQRHTTAQRQRDGTTKTDKQRGAERGLLGGGRERG